jgi:quinolinate synthase
MNTLVETISRLKRDRNAVILAHTYQPWSVQDLADYVGDSYGLSVEATRTAAKVIVFCGVRFMAETAAILNPDKAVILAEPNAGCPMADMITADELAAFKSKHPGHIVICYVNSTAEVKALADICCTSSNALKIVRQIPAEQGIIFVPDKHLGSWIVEQTGRPMVLWGGFCPTHMRITPAMIESARRRHPQALVLIHPEAKKECRDLADAVLSTGGMCDFVKYNAAREFIIATETGIVHTLERQCPDKSYYSVDDCVTCPNMKRGSPEATLRALDGSGGELIVVPEAVANQARRSLDRMMTMSK